MRRFLKLSGEVGIESLIPGVSSGMNSSRLILYSWNPGWNLDLISPTRIVVPAGTIAEHSSLWDDIRGCFPEAGINIDGYEVPAPSGADVYDSYDGFDGDSDIFDTSSLRCNALS